eukprot:gene7239-11557_t
MEKVTDFLINNKVLTGSVIAFSSLYLYSNVLYPLLNRGSNGYGSSTTAEEIGKGINLKGKVAIITGSNTGIGLVTAKVLAQQGAHIILSGRNEKKLKDALETIQKATSKDVKVNIIPMDLGSSKSIDNFVESFKKLNLPLHYLINNAGVMATPKQKTTDGFEYQSGINHLGHFRLTLKLLPIMKETEGERRIVVVSSRAHTRIQNGKIDFDDFHWEKKDYSSMGSYSQSKLANVMFANELNRKLKKDNIPITVNSLHPGVIPGTDLSRDLVPWYLQPITPIVVMFLKSNSQGAATTVYATIHPELKGKGGEYLSDCNIFAPIEYAKDENEAKKLWDFSEKETNTKYPF